MTGIKRLAFCTLLLIIVTAPLAISCGSSEEPDTALVEDTAIPAAQPAPSTSPKPDSSPAPEPEPTAPVYLTPTSVEAGPGEKRRFGI